MKRGAFFVQIKECWKILQSLDMDGEYVSNPQYPKSPRAYFKGMTYVEIWKACLNNRFYHCQLHDSSLMYFGFTGEDLFSLCFYQFPFDAATYSEFIDELGFTYFEVGENLRDDYEDYLSTCKVRESISTIRYDINYDLYKEARHPVSHIHIGHENHIRIRTEKIMGPLSFLYFILRQQYPEKWILYSHDVEKYLLHNQMRNNLTVINGSYLSDWDKCELYLL